MELCPSCGEPAYFGVADLCYVTREIELDACCETNLTGWVEAFSAADRQTRVDWMLRETGLAVRDAIANETCLSWTLDYGLEFSSVSFPEAAAFVTQHHRHNDAPQGWKFGAAVYNGQELIGVVIAGRPVSAALQQQGCLEITRDCVKLCSPEASPGMPVRCSTGMPAEKVSNGVTSALSPIPSNRRAALHCTPPASFLSRQLVAEAGIARTGVASIMPRLSRRFDGSAGRKASLSTS